MNSEPEFHQKVLSVESLHKGRRYADAVRQGKKLLTENPNHVPLLRIVGYAALPIKEFDVAERALRAACQHDSDRERARIALGDLERERGNRKKAAAYYQEAISTARDPLKSYIKQIELAVENENVEAERELIRKAIWKCSPNPKYLNLWFKRLRDLEGAQAALVALKRYRWRRPRNKTLLLLQARLLSELGQRTEALKFLLSIEAKVGDTFEWFKFLMQNIRVTGEYPAGWTAERVQQEFKDRCLELIRTRPDAPDGYYELAGGIRNSEGAKDSHPFEVTPTKTQALDLYLLAAKKAPERISLQLALYRMFRRAGKQKEAKSLLEKLAVKFPGDEEVSLERARLALRERDYVIAQEEVGRAFDKGRGGLEWSTLAGDLSAANGRFDEALLRYNEGYVARPGDQQVARNYITVAIQLGKLEEAERCIEPFVPQRESVRWVDDLLSVIEKQQIEESSAPTALGERPSITGKLEEVRALSKSGKPYVWKVSEELCESFKEYSDEIRTLLFRATSVIPETEQVEAFLEEHYRVATSSRTNAELTASSERVCVGVGAGLGNILQATPMIAALAEFLGHPVDVFCYSPVPHVETVFGQSDFVNMAFGDIAALRHRAYDKVFVTGSVGHAIPSMHATQAMIQRRQYQMMEECRIIHETAYNFKGLDQLFPNFQHERTSEDKFFIRDLTRVNRTFPKDSSDTVVGLCDGKVAGTWMKREWERFEELSKALKTEKYTVRSFGLKGQAIPGTEDWTGTSLRECFENISACDLFLGSDGGLFHVAEALGVPTAVLFGPTSVIKNGPARSTTRIIHQALSCSPCQWKLDFARCDNNRCMTDISVSHVVDELNALQSELRGDPPALSTPARLQQILEHETASAGIPYRDDLRDAALQESVSHYPLDPRFYEQAFKANLHAQEFERCEQLLEILSSGVHAEELPLDLWRAEICFYRKEFEPALHLLESLPSLPSLSVDSTGDVSLMRARVLLKLRRFQEVVDLGCVEIGIDSKDAEQCWLYGNACRELGDWEGAANAFQQGLERKPGLSRLLTGLESLQKDTFLKIPYRELLSESVVAGFSKEQARVVVIAEPNERIPTLSPEIRSAVKLFKYDLEEIDECQESFAAGALIWIAGSNSYREKVVSKLPQRAQEHLLGAGDLESELREMVSPIEQPRKRMVLFAHHHLSRWNPHGGEFSMHEIMQRLKAKDQYEILIVVANSKNTEVCTEVYEELPYAVASQYRFADTVKNVLECYQPDLALMWGPHSMKTGPICKEYNVPVTLFVRYWKVVCDAPYDRDILSDAITDAERRTFLPLYQAADKIITNAEHVSQVIEKRFDVSSQCAYVPVQPPEKGYEPLAIQDRKFVTLINPRKADGEKIVRDLALALPHIPFQVIGEPSISLPKNVRLRPYMKAHYTEILKDSRLLLFPFGEEPCGTGRVAFEAFYSQVPVVGPAIGGLPEVIPKEWLVSQNGDIEQWKKIVEELWTNPPLDVITQLPERMVQFDAEENLKIVDNTLDELLK